MRIVDKKDGTFELVAHLNLNRLKRNFEGKFRHVIEMCVENEFLPNVLDWKLSGASVIVTVEAFEHKSLETYLKEMAWERNERLNKIEDFMDNLMIVQDELLNHWNSVFKRFMLERGFVCQLINGGYHEDTYVKEDGQLIFVGIERFMLHEYDFYEQKTYAFRAMFNDLMRNDHDRNFLAIHTVPFIQDNIVHQDYMNRLKALKKQEAYLEAQLTDKKIKMEEMFTAQELREKLGEEQYKLFFETPDDF